MPQLRLTATSEPEIEFLRRTAKPNSKTYEKGQQVTDEEMKLLNIRAHRTLPEWNYTIQPYAQK